eukprot:TRINITY_DN649_c0_g2_i2.p1 TRINITY_DN649_c0_g2~~TRINITY_DN649_c0_g2_i2.p1  ORF type:complete len:251 (+),score=131.07 TRINITY_DN649_c0_g2_i2:58-810(+)
MSGERRESVASPRSCVCGVGKHNLEVSHDPELKGIVENNKEWVRSVNEVDPTFFEKLGQGQSPKYLYIGCSDARVDPTRLLGLAQGELFVHRNVGNCCPNDLNFLSVLEYAVNFLKVPHIIICGHYDCGAVRNSGKVQDIGLLENWIRQIRDVTRLHDTELLAVEDPETKHRRLVELNAVEQAKNVLKTACVQRRRHETRDRDAAAAEADGGYAFATPQVHAFVFSPADGLVKKLDDELHPEEHIYNLYE